MTTKSITEKVAALREYALARGQRMSSVALYRHLVACMQLAEECEADAQKLAEVKELFKAQAVGKRRWVESNTSTAMMVCRFVWDTEKDSSAVRTNAWRYGTALDVAREEGVASDGLMERLRNGGVNSLFQRRKIRSTPARTKTLYLDRQITVPPDAAFWLRLRRNANGWFDLLEQPSATPSANTEKQT